MRCTLRHAPVSHPGRLGLGQSIGVCFERNHHALVTMQRREEVATTDSIHEIWPLKVFDVVAPPQPPF